MARTLASSGLATAAVFFAYSDNDVGVNTYKDFGPNACALAVASGANTPRTGVTWGSNTVISRHDANQVAPLIDVTMSTGILTDPGCIVVLMYNQSGAAPTNRTLAECSANGPGIQSKTDGSGICYVDRSRTDPGWIATTSNVTTGSYLLAFDWDHTDGTHGARAYLGTAGGAVSVDTDGPAIGTLVNGTGALTNLFYRVGTSVGWPGEPVLVLYGNRRTNTTELSSINADPEGTLFKSGGVRVSNMSGGMQQLTGGIRG